MTTMKTILDREALRVLARDRKDSTKPLVLLENRGTMDKSYQDHFYRIANEYSFIQARQTWWCNNPECKVILPDGRYYYKFKGSRAYWNYRRYGTWDRCCKLCYYDHVLNPNTNEWKVKMEGIISYAMREAERNLNRDNSPVRPRRR